MSESLPLTEEGVTVDALRAQVIGLQLALAQEREALANERAQVATLTRERDTLRGSYERLRLEVELMRRRIFVAKAERVDTAQLELEFAEKLAELKKLSSDLDKATDDAKKDSGDANSNPPQSKRASPKGRRNLADSSFPEVRVEIRDPEMDARVALGEAKPIGFEESFKLAWQRGGHRKLVIARVKYRVGGDSPETTDIVTAPMPPQAFARSLAAPSMLAHIVTDKFCDGLPLNRIEKRHEREGLDLDRGTMCRWMEEAGATVGATVVEAARKEALATAFCIATDATGICVQPERTNEKKRQPCRRGHYFVQIADRDHIFFEYTAKEDSAAVREMFRGFNGFVQADAKSVFNILFRPPDQPDFDGKVDLADHARRIELACWSHARRGLWEAAIAKSVVGREGLYRISMLFDLEKRWKHRKPEEIKALRQQYAKTHVESFFAWAAAQFELVKDERGIVRSALGYVLRHKDALMRYLEDGRLVMDNNRSERELRQIAVGRNAWLFVGSDDHAQSTGHLFSLIASARLHRLDPEAYLRDLFRVLGHWPKDRYLELAPRYFAATRARLDPVELAAEIGPLRIPPAMATATQQEPAQA